MIPKGGFEMKTSRTFLFAFLDDSFYDVYVLLRKIEVFVSEGCGRQFRKGLRASASGPRGSPCRPQSR